MTIDEAINELERGTTQSRSTRNQRLRKALLLGLEALKGITAIRCGAISNVNEPLPGETKE